jgi:2-polyprenyl-6-methoxyphenol hydroxylase-like FAD-dependent oxidoreductase
VTRDRALVAGAGIGGLAAALALERADWDVEVLEQAERLGEIGAALTLWPNAIRALDALDVGAEVRSRGTAQGVGGLRRPDGRWLTRSSVDALERRQGAPAVVLHRADLHAILLDRLGAGRVQTGVRVLGASADGGGVTVATSDGERRAALLVGADGLRSPVRASVLPGAPGPREAGYVAWRAVVSAPWVARSQTAETWGRGRRFGVVPLGDGRVYWFAATGPEVAPGALAACFAGWHEPVERLLAAMPPEAVLRHPIAYLGALPRFAGARWALVGDAAHAMTPDLGQGGCQALEDAVELGAALGGHRPLPEALAAYDAARRPRAQVVARRSRTLGRIAQATGIAAVVRDAAMHLTPARVTERGVDRLLAWTPPAGPDP